MHKEEDKLSLNMNEDFTLPNLEEGMEINEIPSIEDLISLDKEEVEKIQATEIADIFHSLVFKMISGQRYDKMAK